MGVDKTTVTSYVNIVLDNKKEYLELLKKSAEEDFAPDECLALRLDYHSFQPSEIYYQEDEGELYFSGTLVSNETSATTHITISFPISDIVMIDIIQAAVKKMNKLKTVLESLK